MYKFGNSKVIEINKTNNKINFIKIHFNYDDQNYKKSNPIHWVPIDNNKVSHFINLE